MRLQASLKAVLGLLVLLAAGQASAATVQNLADSGPGSLRDAIASASAGDTIDFGSLTGTITLATEIGIAKDLTIRGPGAGVLTLSGGDVCRVFDVTAGTVALSGMTLAHGGGGGGGAIMANTSSGLTLTEVVVRDSTAAGGTGGGMYSYGNTNIDRCAFLNNYGSSGGGIFVNGSNIIVRNSLFSGNSADWSGGGFCVNSASSVTLINCTFAGNSAKTYGGAIYSSPNAALTNCTLTGNTCDSDNNNSGDGGGGYGDLTLKNTIVAGNADRSSQYPDIYGTINSQGYNLIGNVGALNWSANTSGDHFGDPNNTTTPNAGAIESASAINPLLGALADNGGPTQTCALLAGSPAMDNGTSSGAPATDQRGVARPQNGVVDIGAYESDTAAPALSGNIAVPANGTYKAGGVLSFTLTFTEGVTVSGTAQTLTLDIGGVARQAAYASKTADSVTYTYTVQAGETDTDGIAVSAVTLNGDTVRDTALNDADLTLTGHVPDLSGVRVDTVPPAIAGTIAVPANGGYKAGDVLSFALTFTEGVTVSGMAQTLTLDIGGVARQAAYASKTANSVTYTYTVQAGETDTDGIAVSAVTLNGDTVRDTALNDADLTLTGHVPDLSGVRVDTVPPAIAGTIAVPANGGYKAGDVLSFALTFTEGVTVSGMAQTLTLDIGGVARQAAYASKTADSVTYTYTVQAGETDTDGIAVSAVTLNGDTLRDAALNDADLTLTGHVPDLSGVRVDTTRPTISGNIVVPSNGLYKAGEVLNFAIAFSENVTITGSAQALTLNIGGVERQAAFASKTAQVINYAYTVVADDSDVDGITISAVALKGDTIRDAAGNDAHRINADYPIDPD